MTSVKVKPKRAFRLCNGHKTNNSPPLLVRGLKSRLKTRQTRGERTRAQQVEEELDSEEVKGTYCRRFNVPIPVVCLNGTRRRFL